MSGTRLANRGSNAEAPVRVLIEAQDLAGEGHPEGEQEQDLRR